VRFGHGAAKRSGPPRARCCLRNVRCRTPRQRRNSGPRRRRVREGPGEGGLPSVLAAGQTRSQRSQPMLHLAAGPSAGRSVNVPAEETTDGVESERLQAIPHKNGSTAPVPRRHLGSAGKRVSAPRWAYRSTRPPASVQSVEASSPSMRPYRPSPRGPPGAAPKGVRTLRRNEDPVDCDFRKVGTWGDRLPGARPHVAKSECRAPVVAAGQARVRACHRGPHRPGARLARIPASRAEIAPEEGSASRAWAQAAGHIPHRKSRGPGCCCRT